MEFYHNERFCKYSRLQNYKATVFNFLYLIVIILVSLLFTYSFIRTCTMAIKECQPGNDGPCNEWLHLHVHMFTAVEQEGMILYIILYSRESPFAPTKLEK